MNLAEMYKREMMDKGIDINDEESVRKYITNAVGYGEKPREIDEYLIKHIMTNLGFGKDESKYTYNEIFKLKDMLEEANIPFRMDKYEEGGYQIKYFGKYYNPFRIICSVLEIPTSYGVENDLLTIHGLMTIEEMIREQDDVLGYLTAEDVFNRISNHYHKND